MTIRVNDEIIGEMDVPDNIAVDTIEISPDVGDGIFVGPDFGWRDIIGPVTTDPSKNPDNVPEFNAYGTTAIYQYQFTSLLDQTFHVFHMPHDWVPGTDLYIHAHWSTEDAADGGDVVWGWEAVWAKRDSEAFTGTSLMFEVTGASSTTPMTHLVHEVALTSDAPVVDGTFDIADMEVDGLFLVRTYLKTNNCGQAPFLHTVDLHYQSSNIGTKNKASNFYT